MPHKCLFRGAKGGQGQLLKTSTFAGMCFLQNHRVDSGSGSFLLPLRNMLGVLCYQTGRGEGVHGQLNKGDANSCASANTAVGLFVRETFGAGLANLLAPSQRCEFGCF